VYTLVIVVKLTRLPVDPLQALSHCYLIIIILDSLLHCHVAILLFFAVAVTGRYTSPMLIPQDNAATFAAS